MACCYWSACTLTSTYWSWCRFRCRCWFNIWIRFTYNFWICFCIWSFNSTHITNCTFSIKPVIFYSIECMHIAIVFRVIPIYRLKFTIFNLSFIQVIIFISNFNLYISTEIMLYFVPTILYFNIIIVNFYWNPIYFTCCVLLPNYINFFILYIHEHFISWFFIVICKWICRFDSTITLNIITIPVDRSYISWFIFFDIISSKFNCLFFIITSNVRIYVFITVLN